MGDQEIVKQMNENYWYVVEEPWQGHECCGCGMKHDVAFRIAGGKLFWRWRLADDEEAGAERSKGKPREKAGKEAGGVVSKGKKADGKHPRKHARSGK